MRELASRLADDEESAWGELYDATADTMFGYVVALLGSRESAADVFQEAFLRLHRSRERFREIDDLNAFVFTVIRNETNRKLKKNQKQVVSREFAEAYVESHSRSDVNSQMNDAELIRHVLSNLSCDEQELIRMKVYAQMTMEQIATILGLPIGTCASRYRRSLLKMRVLVQEQTE